MNSGKVLFLFLCGSASGLLTQDAVSWRVVDIGNGSGYENTKIVGGTATTISTVPYLVNLRLKGRFICGGSLITTGCVLTAAHCVYGIQSNDLTIHAGSSRLTNPGDVRPVQQIFISSLYKPKTLDMDVAILRLAKSYDRNGRERAGGAARSDRITTILLCNAMPPNGALVKISGWGITDESNYSPQDRVRIANIHIVPFENCSAAYSATGLSLTDTMLCATELGIKDSCLGDSGGPLVYNGRVCGIVSWGIGCARINYPGVYTNVLSSRVNAFIRQIMHRNC